jgi:hypothetical protein
VTAQSERTKPVLVAKRFHAISQASMMAETADRLDPSERQEGRRGAMANPHYHRGSGSRGRPPVARGRRAPALSSTICARPTTTGDDRTPGTLLAGVRARRQNAAASKGGGARSGSRGDRPVAISARPISSPVSRHPNPAPVSLGPVTGNPIGARVRAGNITAGHPHPAVSAPAPVPGLPNHRGARRGWDGLLLGRRWTTWSAISLTGISRRLRGAGITRRLVRIGIGGRWILLCNRQRHRGH